MQTTKQVGFFQTEMSHDSHCSDKQFSPWVKSNPPKVTLNLPTSVTQNDKLKISQQFLAMIKRARFNAKSPLIKDLENNSQQQDSKTSKEKIKQKAQQKFNQVLRRNLNTSRLIQKFQIRSTVRRVNLSLQTNEALRISPLFLTLDHQSPAPKQHFLPRKTKKTTLSHDRSHSHTSQSNRYSILRTQQIFSKTLQPYQRNMKILEASLEKERKEADGMSFPLRPKPNTALTMPKQQKQKSMQECNVMGESINLGAKQKVRSRRLKLREHYQREKVELAQRIFLQ